MRFNTTHKEELQLNLAPLIDVVFLLLIFFMVTTSFTQEKALDLQLPKSKTGEALKTPSGLKLEISVSKNDDIKLLNDHSQLAFVPDNEKTADLSKQIQLAIEKIKSGNPSLQTSQIPIVIEADKQASHGRIIQLMDAINLLGIKQIQFVVEQE